MSSASLRNPRPCVSNSQRRRCRRPGIFRDTLDSFRGNLRGVDFQDCTLYLNLDPAPAEGDGDAVEATAREVFGTVIVNRPAEPCFPAAVKWCWSATGRGVFCVSLEDDWILQKPVEIGDMLAALQADPTLSLVNLRAYRHSDDRLCLAPGLWRTDHAKAIAAKMRTDANPEMQLRRKRPNNPHGDLHVGYRGLQFPEASRAEGHRARVDGDDAAEARRVAELYAVGKTVMLDIAIHPAGER
jgi:hypothetical protein